MSSYSELLKKVWNQDPNKSTLIDPFFIKYRIDDNVILVFNLMLGKLAKISYLNNYNHEILESVKIGMNIKSISEKYKLSYNEDENYYFINDKNNVALFFENPYLSIIENPTNKLEEVTVYDADLLLYPN